MRGRQIREQAKTECEMLVEGFFEEFDKKILKAVEELKTELAAGHKKYQPPEDFECIIDEMLDIMGEASTETRKDLIWYCYFGRSADKLVPDIVGP